MGTERNLRKAILGENIKTVDFEAGRVKKRKTGPSENSKGPSENLKRMVGKNRMSG